MFHARQSGYHRLAADQTVVIADTGCPPQPAFSGGAHAGTLSFELSSEASRIVVNCGRPVGEDGDWRRLSRSTAAHSTVTIADQSSSRFARSESLDRFLGTPLVPGPTHVDCAETGDSGLGFEATHDGYDRGFGLLHSRRIEVSRDGRSVFGADRFLRGSGHRPQMIARDATARFHLHPSVVVETAGAAIRLSVRDQTWLFRCDSHCEIEDSIFFADAAGARRTLQIVVPFDALSPEGVAWRFDRER
nr:heparinase II/III family protein [Aurantimonas endophytica]